MKYFSAQGKYSPFVLSNTKIIHYANEGNIKLIRKSVLQILILCQHDNEFDKQRVNMQLKINET